MLYWSGGVWIFSGITQCKTNEIRLISYFVYVLGGFNFACLCYTILISPVTRSEQIWYTVNSLCMDLLCLKCTAHTKCDSFKALRVIAGKEQNIFLLFLFQHTVLPVKKKARAPLKCLFFFSPTFQVHTLYFNETLTQIITLHSFF